MKNPKPTPKLFLFEPPFTVDETPAAVQSYIYESGTMEELELKQMNSVNEMILKTAQHEDLIQILGEGAARDIETNTGAVRWAINWMDFRGLLDDYVMAKLVGCMESEGGYMGTCFADLHSRLGVLHDHRILNTMANRTIRSVSAIPYPITLNQYQRDWVEVHSDYPFIWLCIQMQALIHSEFRTKPRTKR